MSDRKCHICDSAEHDFCGFCAHCKEHTVFVRTCFQCEDACYPGEDCTRMTLPQPHIPDPESEALSVCCGAAGYAYDHDPS